DTAGLQLDVKGTEESAVIGPKRGNEQDHDHRQVAGPDQHIGESRVRGHPATLTVVVAPHRAMDRARSRRLTVTRVRRTAPPTAMPTPAGPPLALNPNRQ